MTPRSEIVAGRIPVLECLRARKRTPRRLFLLQSAHGLEELRAAADTLPVKETGRTELDQLAQGVVHQGVVLMADPLPLLDLESWLGSLINSSAAASIVLVALDSVEDPQNFGGIVRSSAACGARGILFAKDRSAPVSTAAVKAAAGAMEHVPLVQVTNLTRALQVLKDQQFWIAGLEAGADKTLWQCDLKGRIVLLIGSEGKGIRRLVGEQCDFTMRIPLEGPITSLNASVSAAIALVETLRQNR